MKFIQKNAVTARIASCIIAWSSGLPVPCHLADWLLPETGLRRGLRLSKTVLQMMMVPQWKQLL